ncbi:MAG: glutathione peroxidase [Vallitalea sp.]|jgi:glutathione peroxidase|nr:glutathione peroxidase [Vallitalea sp.]
MSIYNFSAKTIDGKVRNFDEYKGKVLIIVNTASKCGFTPQYDDLQKLYKEYMDKGVEILGFPCNQFAAQEPGSSKDVKEFCTLNFGVTFQLFEKIDVNGANAHPLFKYLIDKAPFNGFDMSNPSNKILDSLIKNRYPELVTGDSIRWNFTKFLIDRKGNVVNRFESSVDPMDLKPYIEEIL